MDIDFTRIYEDEKNFLWRYCYRLSGNAAEAEDLVQDIFVKAMEKPPADLARPWRPWLVRVATNLATDRARRSNRSKYVGPWLPTPVVTNPEHRLGGMLCQEPSGSGRYEMQESASIAFLLALEALTPSQRAVLLLRDVYDYSVKETAEMSEMSEANVKTTLHRARESLAGYDGERIPLDAQRIHRTGEVLRRLMALLAAKDVAGIESLLAANVEALSDGNGRFYAAKKPVNGASKVALMYSKIAPPDTESVQVQVASLNFLPAIVMDRPEAPEGIASRSAVSIDLNQEGQVSRIFTVVAPSKLVGTSGLR